MTDPVSESFRQLQLEAALADESEAERKLEELTSKIADHESRWDEDALRDAVADVLAGAMRDAGQRRSDEVARAMAPHVVGTIRREIVNSQDELVEALHPRMGTLVREAVTNAVSELQRQVDEALPLDVWIAQIKGRLFGVPVLGSVLRPVEPFRIHEAYLIERGSGVLLARDATDAKDEDLDDDLVAGMIAAIDSFSTDAFGHQNFGELRSIETEAGRLYLRATAKKILALRCSGTAPSDVEARIDRLLERTIDKAQAGDIGIVSERLVELAEGSEAERPSSFRVVLNFAVAGLTVLAVWWGHGRLERHNAERWRGAVEASVQTDPAMRGYPLSVRADREAATILIEGLVPDPAARTALLSRAEWETGAYALRSSLPVAGTRLSQ